MNKFEYNAFISGIFIGVMFSVISFVALVSTADESKLKTCAQLTGKECIIMAVPKGTCVVDMEKAE